MVDALEHDVLGAHIEQIANDLPDLLVRDVLSGVLSAGENGGFGQVRHEQVRAIDERAHRLAKLCRVRGIHLTGIAHYRVDKTQRLGVLAIQSLYDRHLIGGAEESGVDAIELNALLLPGVEVSAQHVGGVFHGEHLVASMRREQSGRHRADIASGSREDRDGGGERAFAVPAHVMHRCDAWNIFAIAFVKHFWHIAPCSHRPYMPHTIGERYAKRIPAVLHG